jgi:hypothetical protein
VKLYVLTYWMSDYIKPCLDSIIGGTKTDLDIVIGENLSPHSEKSREIIRQYIKDGKIKEAYFFDANLYVSAFKYLYILSPPTDEGDYVVFCESDVVWQSKKDWLEEEFSVIKNFPEIGLVAYDLDPINYVPPNSGHLESIEFTIDQRTGIYLGASSGIWLLLVHKHIADKLDVCYPTYIECALHNWTPQLGFLYGRMREQMYHLGWDAWKDDPEYFEQKYRMIESFQQTISLSTYTRVTIDGEEKRTGW